MSVRRQMRIKLPEMEGTIARRYTRLRSSASQMATYRRQALQLAEGLPDGCDVLEIAPGPGHLAIEIARLSRYHVTGLDISHTFVEIAGDNARRAGVTVDFRQGDASRMPFDADSFDLIACQAAFKNFMQPLTALNEMHRVLRKGGTAVIQDMSRDASNTVIDDEVKGMELGALSAFMTKWTLVMLRRRAYSPTQFERLVAESAFRTCTIRAQGLGMEVRLTKLGAA
jgi:ubiquinone/menaquinone biosynthesis C-methylase UbiE